MNDPAQYRLWSIPGDGVLARQGNLVLLISIDDRGFAESLLDLLTHTNEAGGDGRALADAIGAAVERHQSWGGSQAGPSILAFGPAGGGLAFSVSGTAFVEISTEHGKHRLVAGHPSMLLKSVVAVPVLTVRGGLGGTEPGDRTDRFTRLDSGTVRAWGLSYSGPPGSPGATSPAGEPRQAPRVPAVRQATAAPPAQAVPQAQPVPEAHVAPEVLASPAAQAMPPDQPAPQAPADAPAPPSHAAPPAWEAPAQAAPQPPADRPAPPAWAAPAAQAAPQAEAAPQAQPTRRPAQAGPPPQAGPRSQAGPPSQAGPASQAGPPPRAARPPQAPPPARPPAQGTPAPPAAPPGPAPGRPARDAGRPGPGRAEPEAADSPFGPSFELDPPFLADPPFQDEPPAAAGPFADEHAPFPPAPAEPARRRPDPGTPPFGAEPPGYGPPDRGFEEPGPGQSDGTGSGDGLAELYELGLDEPGVAAAAPAPQTSLGPAAPPAPKRPPAEDPDTLTEESAGSPLVMGVHCKNGHFTDPDARSCVVCGTGIPRRSGTVERGPRPALGVLILEDGATVAVDGDYVVGRDPARDQSVSSGEARPLRVVDAESTVSRIHAEVHLEGWQVLLTDLGSANGTRVQQPGAKTEQMLEPKVPVPLQHGTQIFVGASSLRYERAGG